MTHTPGPWYVVDKQVRGLASGQIATVGGDFYDDGRKDADGWTFSPPLDTAANARLIAAAPELLAALKNHLPWQEEPVQGWGLWKDAVDAIARAEGRD
jgi:hypothetical protein